MQIGLLVPIINCSRGSLTHEGDEVVGWYFRYLKNVRIPGDDWNDWCAESCDFSWPVS